MDNRIIQNYKIRIAILITKEKPGVVFSKDVKAVRNLEDTQSIGKNFVVDGKVIVVGKV